MAGTAATHKPRGAPPEPTATSCTWHEMLDGTFTAPACGQVFALPEQARGAVVVHLVVSDLLGVVPMVRVLLEDSFDGEHWAVADAQHGIAAAGVYALRSLGPVGPLVRVRLAQLAGAASVTLMAKGRAR